MANAASEFDRTAVVTIQGGGIFGLNLLGQLQTIVDRFGIVPLGLAGTSAGAIIATLYWAGFTPRAIRGLFIELARENQLTELLGPFDAPPRGGFTFASFRSLKDRYDLALKKFDGPPAVASPEWGLKKMALYPYRAARSVATRVGLAMAVNREIAAVRPHLMARGFFHGKQFEDTIDRWIRSSPKIAPHAGVLPADRLLCFGDLRTLAQAQRIYFPPLFLTATDVTTCRLELFNSIEDDYAMVPIAKAVRASAGFPIFFRPVPIAWPSRPPEGGPQGVYVDGGVVSNFPAWVFSREYRRLMAASDQYRDLAPIPWTHIGLRVVDDPAQPRDVDVAPRFFASLFSLLTGQARNELENILARLVPRTITIDQPTADTSGPENVLDIDKVDERTILAMVTRGAEYAEMAIRRYQFVHPGDAVIEGILSRLVAKALAVLGQGDDNAIQPRGGVFLRQANELVRRYAWNVTGARDRRMAVDAGLPGFSFTRRRPVVANLEQIEANDDGPSRPEVLRRILADWEDGVEPARTWLAGMPIFDPQDFSIRPIPGPADDIPAGLVHTLESTIDGPILGVLTLDAALDYDAWGLSPDPAAHLGDSRVQAILDIMWVTAFEIGQILSSAFAARRDNP